jgi:hypothetical protein
MLAEMEENKTFREDTRKNFKTVSEKLVEISTERRMFGLLIPAIVAVVVTGIAKAIGF